MNRLVTLLLTARRSVFSLVTSLCGNALVLLASIKYNAVKIDKISITLIENLAVADLVSYLLRKVIVFLAKLFTSGINFNIFWHFAKGVSYLGNHASAYSA